METKSSTQERLNILKRVILNDRMKDYRSIVQYALSKGYIVCSLRDWIINKNNYKDKKILILRHDIDLISPATEVMLQIEKENKVSASYYFRKCTLDYNLMRKIEASGGEASYHFETVSEFATKNNIIDRRELMRFEFVKPCLEQLRNELVNIRNTTKLPCITIASHGAKRNVQVQTENHYITKGKEAHKFLGILLESYDDDFLESVSCYISDCTIENHGGYRYGRNPIEAINDNENMILFLSHPNHWNYSYLHRLKKIIKILILPIISRQTKKAVQ